MKAEGKSINTIAAKVDVERKSVMLCIRNLMKTLKLSAQQAVEALMILADEQDKYLSKL